MTTQTTAIDLALSWSGHMLDLLGAAHECPREPGEADDGYRARLRPAMVAAFEAVVPVRADPARDCLRVALLAARRGFW